jgi:hypothetical protein
MDDYLSKPFTRERLAATLAALAAAENRVAAAARTSQASRQRAAPGLVVEASASTTRRAAQSARARRHPPACRVPMARTLVNKVIDAYLARCAGTAGADYSSAAACR